MRLDELVILAAVAGTAITSASVAAPPAAAKKEAVAAAQEPGWAAATALVQDYFTKMDGAPPKKIQPSGELPFMFFVTGATRRWSYVLVHQGQLLTEYGVPPVQAETAAKAYEAATKKAGTTSTPPPRFPNGAEHFAAYLKDVDLLGKHKTVTAEELTSFADAFDVLPFEPEVGASGYYIALDGDDADLNPRIAFTPARSWKSLIRPPRASSWTRAVTSRPSRSPAGR